MGFSNSEERSEPGTGASGRKRRLFFALWPDDSLRQRLEHDLRKVIRSTGGAAIPARNLHLTLVFLGSIDETQRQAACEAARAVVRPPFDLALDRIETWPRQRLLCLAPGAPSGALHDLAIDLRDRLLERRLELERRPFRAHLTLARKVVRPRMQEAVSPLTWPVRDFVLVDSVTGPRGSDYTILQRWPLGR